MAEHKERYMHVTQEFSKQGYVCVIHDLQGHGKSVQNKDVLEYFHDMKGTFIREDILQFSLDRKKIYLVFR